MASHVASWYILGACIGIVVFALFGIFSDIISPLIIILPNPPGYPESVCTIVLYNYIIYPFVMMAMAVWLLIGKRLAVSVALFAYFLVSVTLFYVIFGAYIDLFIFLFYVLFLFIGVVGAFVYRKFVYETVVRQKTPDAYYAYSERLRAVKDRDQFYRRQPPKNYAQHALHAKPYPGESYRGEPYPGESYRSESYPGKKKRQINWQPEPSEREKPLYMPAIILGIFAIATCWAFGLPSITLGALGIMLTYANREDYQTTTGFILNFIGFILGISVFLVMVYFFI